MQKLIVWNEPGSIEALIDALQTYEIVAGTSDTVIGLLALLSENSHMRLNEIKMRDDKPYIILIESSGRVPLFAKPIENPRLKAVIDACWPGPLTIILPAKEDLPRFMQSKEGTVALRVPKHVGLLSLLNHFDGLFSTSANQADNPIPKNLQQLDPSILSQVQYLVADPDNQERYVSSTILDCMGEKPRVVRKGAYEIEELERLYGEPFER